MMFALNIHLKYGGCFNCCLVVCWKLWAKLQLIGHCDGAHWQLQSKQRNDIQTKARQVSVWEIVVLEDAQVSGHRYRRGPRATVDPRPTALDYCVLRATGYGSGVPSAGRGGERTDADITICTEISFVYINPVPMTVVCHKIMTHNQLIV